MKRYIVTCKNCDTDFGLKWEENYQGQWVEWADHDREIKRITEIYEKRIREIKEKTNQLLKVTFKSQEDREMKRYTLHERVLDREDETITGNFKGQMFEDPSGEWVRWEDVKDVVNELWLKNIKLVRDNIGTDLSKGNQQPECNCEENLMADFRMPFWICPAHGYKKR